MFLRKLKTGLTHEPAIPLLGIYMHKPNSKDTCTRMFIATLFTIAKIWEQLACPWTDEWRKKMWCIYIYIYDGILLSHKNSEIMSFVATWMPLEIIY